MDYREICCQVQKIAREAGRFIGVERRKLAESDIEIKSAANFVTYVDKTSEKNIVSALKELLPGSGFITEEGTASESGEEFKWIIDPLDGTTNYIHGIMPYSVSIALMEGQEIVVGVVYEIVMDEMFYAWKGSPAYLNGNEIRVSPSSSHEQCLIATGFPYYDFERLDDYIEVMKTLMKNTRGLRRFGSAAADLSYVAAGRFNAFYEHALHSWDVAAGAFIVKQAGGRVTDFDGGDNWLFGGELVAAGEAYFPEFFKVVNCKLGNK